LHADLNNILTEQSQLLDFIDSNEPAFTPFIGLPEYGSQQSLPQSFPTPPALHSQFDFFVASTPVQGISVTPDLFPILDAVVQHFEPEADHSSEVAGRSATDHTYQTAISLPENTVEPFEGIGQTHFNDKRTLDIAEDDQHNRHAQESALSATIGSASLTEQTSLPPHKPGTFRRPEQPPRNSDGKIICEYIECSNVTFAKLCDWK
jgi:hypothetical protein